MNLVLGTEPNIELKFQSVCRDMMFLAFNSLHNLGVQKWSCPYYHTRKLRQIHWNKVFCGMYGCSQIFCCNFRLPCLLLIRLSLSTETRVNNLVYKGLSDWYITPLIVSPLWEAADVVSNNVHCEPFNKDTHLWHN